MWVGEGSPRNSVGTWETGFEAVAIKRMPLNAASRAERNALALVQRQLQGKAGPRHVTALVEALEEQNADGEDEMVLVTK